MEAGEIFDQDVCGDEADADTGIGLAIALLDILFHELQPPEAWHQNDAAICAVDEDAVEVAAVEDGRKGFEPERGTVDGALLERAGRGCGRGHLLLQGRRHGHADDSGCWKEVLHLGEVPFHGFRGLLSDQIRSGARDR